ncbi:hypothetical protein OBBRIDRAFT_17157 [Obba rivulosa]|uniref:Uncharacterized protein n=1 Tax=Obba rivulosa TaxID=1052685 RepID=A0A8E2J8D8_9APHY|nr:hypothetical protein OBBRIDRAFT_17157 [Obba rivulosa]
MMYYRPEHLRQFLECRLLQVMQQRNLLVQASSNALSLTCTQLPAHRCNGEDKDSESVQPGPWWYEEQWEPRACELSIRFGEMSCPAISHELYAYTSARVVDDDYNHRSSDSRDYSPPPSFGSNGDVGCMSISSATFAHTLHRPHGSQNHYDGTTTLSGCSMAT